ncbi:protein DETOXIFICATION 9-like isoform X2 [Lotus japonicus]|uniref:protein DETOXIFICATION 9-like isoform X2 n=1 Tax=Lotus japonicus TaxID=34305 RepID=UPI002588CB59|nr:protein DETOXIFICATION 9-like isoform X2 [Lotus japonicus]
MFCTESSRKMGKEEGAPLLTKSEEENHGVVTPLKSAFWLEFKKVGSMAAPMVAVTVSQYLLQVVSLMMVGHIGILASFSGVAIATSFAEVTGFGVLLGMAGALETLCGQTYGAEDFRKIGNYTCCAICTLTLVCVPITLIWIFTDKILLLFGQEPEISHAAREYCMCLIPALYGYAVLQSLIRYFQTQSMIFPMVFSSIAVLCLHVPICWGLVFKLGMGHVGAAFAIAISYWLNVIGLGLYMNYSPACEKTKIVFSSSALLSIAEFFRFAIPSGLMFCFEWWSFELLTLLAGLLPNPQLETSILSVCLNTTTLHYFIPYAIGASASTRVSNELGAESPKAAQDMVPFLCVSVTADSLIGVLSGIARGGGFQKTGAYVNLGAYYLVGIPIALVLGFVLHLNAKGLWIGVLTGSILQAIILAVVTVVTDWEKEAWKARERILEKSIKAHDGLL